MRYQPLLTVAISPELRTGHEENSPALQPALGVLRPINISHYRQDMRAVSIKILQPGPGSFAVMQAIDMPVLIDRQVILKIKQELVG